VFTLPSDPMLNFLVKFSIGMIAGWIADKISLKRNLSLNVLLGIAGALVGARVAEVLEISPFGFREPLAAILGSIFVLIGWRQLQSR
jgi:uncharacterized membrane protein YeaQ/YmgE (transglycosylase-associated protein family)